MEKVLKSAPLVSTLLVAALTLLGVASAQEAESVGTLATNSKCWERGALKPQTLGYCATALSDLAAKGCQFFFCGYTLVANAGVGGGLPSSATAHAKYSVDNGQYAPWALGSCSAPPLGACSTWPETKTKDITLPSGACVRALTEVTGYSPAIPGESVYVSSKVSHGC